MNKLLCILFFSTFIVSCKKDKTPIVAEPIPAHAPENFELLITVPASSYSLHFLRVGPNGQLIWSANEIWRSSDLGKSWYQVNSPYGSWAAAIVSKDIFFAGTGDIYRTTDNGVSYKNVLVGMVSGNTYDVQYLGVNTVLASGKRIRKSTDLGETWTTVYNHGLDSTFLEKMQFTGNNQQGYVMTTPNINATNWNDILLLKTMNRGNSWEPALVVPDAVCKDFHFASPNVGYAITANTNNVKTLYKTTDGGENWSTMPFTGFSPNIIHFYNETEGYAATYDQLYLTKDGGSTWELLPIIWDNSSGSLTSIVHYKGKVFLAFNTGKLYRSTL